MAFFQRLAVVRIVNPCLGGAINGHVNRVVARLRLS